MLLSHALRPSTEGSVFHIAKDYAEDKLCVLDCVTLKLQTEEVFILYTI